jgi:hypothetical protein
MQLKTKIEDKPTFMDYVMAGYNISLAIGVDFTSSNKSPDEPTSLHSTNLRMFLNRKQ